MMTKQQMVDLITERLGMPPQMNVAKQFAVYAIIFRVKEEMERKKAIRRTKIAATIFAIGFTVCVIAAAAAFTTRTSPALCAIVLLLAAWDAAWFVKSILEIKTLKSGK